MLLRDAVQKTISNDRIGEEKVIKSEKKYWRGLLKKNRGRIAIQFFLMLVSSIVSIAGAYFYMVVVDELTDLKYHKAIYFCMLFVGTNVIGFCIDYWISEQSKEIGNRVEINVKNALFNKLLGKRGKDLTNTDSSEYTSLLLADSSAMSAVINEIMMPSVLCCFRALGMFMFLIYIEWKLILVAIIMQPLVIYIQKKVRVKLLKYSEESRQKTIEYIGAIKEYTSNLFEVITLNNDSYFGKQFCSKLKSQKEMEKKCLLFETKCEKIIEFFMMLPIVSLLIIGGYEVFMERLTIGGLLLYIQYYNGLFSPFSLILNKIYDYERLRPSVKKVMQVLLADEENGLENVNGAIRLQNASFFYESGKTVLKDINIQFEFGKTYGICGESGCGKSTLCKLLLGLWQVTSGKIFYGDSDIELINGKTLRKYVTYISQEDYIFNDSIYNNIVLGKDCDAERFNDILIKANLKEFVNSLSTKEQTMVGDKGALLSGGQKKRIALARTFLVSSPIVILDEPTSGLDDNNAVTIIGNMLEEFSNRIVIIISHQKEIINMCDEKYLLENQKMCLIK